MNAEPSAKDGDRQQQGETSDDWRRKVPAFILDIIFVATVVAAILLIEGDILPGHQGGFFCNDPKLSFVSQGDTVTAKMLTTVTYLAPALLFCAVECCNSVALGGPKSLSHRLLCGLGKALLWFRQFMLGLGAASCITEVGKILMGEPRPHFLHTCRPEPGWNCTSGYVSTYTCTNEDADPWAVSDSMRSFPSGHASTSWYTAAFLIWFVEVRVPGNLTCCLKPWLDQLCVVWALVCSITRITDHRHHWWDVLVGATLGAAVAVFTARFFTRSLYEDQKNPRTETRPILQQNAIYAAETA